MRLRGKLLKGSLLGSLRFDAVDSPFRLALQSMGKRSTMKDTRDGTHGEVLGTTGRQVRLTSLSSCAG